MKKLIALQLLELKRALRALPQLLIGAVLLSFLIGTIAYCSGKLLYRTEALSTITIALVGSDNSELPSTVLDYVNGMGSTNGLFQFRTATQVTAYEQLAAGKITAIIIFPAQIIANIMNGTNEPVQVILPESAGLSSLLLQELTSAGAKTLSSAQAGIYTVTDLYLENGMQAFLEESYQAIDRMNLKYALSRDNLFAPDTALVTGELTAVTYYAASGILLFLLLFGTTCSHFLQKESTAFHQLLRCASISSASYLLIKWITVFMACLIGSLSISFFAYLANNIFFNIKIPFNFFSLLSFLLVLLFISSFILFIFQLAKSAGNGIFLLFTTSILLLFLSGAFIPIAFFPASVRQLSAYLPTTFAMHQIANLFIAKPSAANNIALALYMLMFYSSSVIIQYKREVTNRWGK